MRYHKLDLNLLVIFDKLMAERSVSQVAAQLNLSQPAVSNALARLRLHFEDDLFVHIDRRMAPTPFAESLREGVRETLDSLQKIATTRGAFDPATTERTFTIVASDQAYLTVMLGAIRRLSRIAPGICIRTVLMSDQRGDMLRRGVIDFIIHPLRMLMEDHPYETLFEDEAVCIAWQENDRISEPMTLDEFCGLGHVETTIRSGLSQIDQRLAEKGLSRRIAAYAPNFMLVAETVVGTHYIGSIGARPAALFQARLPLKRVTPPIALHSLTLVLQWHRSREGDPAIVWLRDFLKAEAAETCPAY